MKYLNTREAFLNTINETFENDITFGGSLLGRLVNSIIRKASIEINHNKVGSIAKAIEDELNGLISNGLSDEAKAEINKLLAPLLLEKIYEIVVSDNDDKAKIYQLLGDDDRGLLNVVIKTVNEYPEGTKLGKGDKNTLITKLEEFKSLLEELKTKLGDLTDEEQSDLEDEVIDQTTPEDEKIENSEDTIKANDEEDDNGDEKLLSDTSELLQAVVNIHNYIHKIKVPVKETPKEEPKEQKALPEETKEEPTAQPAAQPAAQDTNLSFETGVETPANAKKESLLDFWSFMYEEYTSPRSREYFKNQKLIKQYKRNAKANPRTDLEVKPAETITNQEANPVNIEKSGLWQTIFRAYKKSGIRDNMPLIVNMLKKAKEGSKLEKQWIVIIGKQIITNEHTIGKNVGKPIEQPAEKPIAPITESYSVVTNDIPKKISLIANAILPFKGNTKAIEELGEPGDYITSFINSYDQIKTSLQTKDVQTTDNTNSGEETKPNEKLATMLIDYLKSAPKVKSDYGNYIIGDFTDIEINENPEKILDRLIEDWSNQIDSQEKTEQLNKLKEISSKSKESTEIAQTEPVEIKTNDNFNILRFNNFLLLREAEAQSNSTQSQEPEQERNLPANIESDEDDKVEDDKVEDDKVEDDKVENEVEDDKVEDTTGVADVKDAWSRAGFEEGEEKQWAINPRELERVQKKIESDKFEISLTDEKDENKKEGEDAKDRIIKIANLFGKAYRLYTTAIIPSGRPGGKISNKTAREYKYIGSGTAPNPTEGNKQGPWASIRVFNKFTDIISGLIENEKYKKIFNYGTIKRTDGTNMKGNVLLEFIRNMIDENTLASYEKNRSILLNKYFRLDVNLQSLTNKDEKDPTATNKTNERVYWNDVSPINIKENSEVGTFIATTCLDRSNKHQIIIGHIVEKDENGIFIKFQFGNELLPISHGYNINIVDRWTLKDSPTKDVYLGLIDPKTPLISNNKFKIAWRKIDNKDVDKETPYEVHYYTPSIDVKKSGTLARQSNKRAMAILTTDDKEGHRIPVKITNEKHTDKILYDINVDIKTEVNNASLKLKGVATPASPAPTPAPTTPVVAKKP